MMKHLGKVFLVLVLLGATTGCDRFVPANQQMMKDAIRASDQAVRSEEKTWAMLLRMEELSQRLEKSVAKAEAAAQQAEEAAQEARRTRQNVKETEATLARAEAAAGEAAAASREAQEAARQAEEAVRRMEAQEGDSLQKMLEFMRELGYKP